jgi:hypothetical protein
MTWTIHNAPSDIDFYESVLESMERHPGHGEDCVTTVCCRLCGEAITSYMDCSERDLLPDGPLCQCPDEEEE